MSPPPPPLGGYPSSTADEVVGAGGRRSALSAVLAPVLGLGAGGLTAAAADLAAAYRERDLVLGSWADGQQTVHPVVLDPLPRLLPAADWTRLAEGAAQRHRALNAFLADAYRAAGRRRSDPDRAPAVVRAGVLPEWAVTGSPGREPRAVGLAWPGQPRAALAACDVVRTAEGRWAVCSDDLQVPAGLGLALAARSAVRDVAPALLPMAGVADPADAVAQLRTALEAAAPPGSSRPPRIAVLSAGERDGTAAEHRLLAEALGVPLVRAQDLWPRVDGGVVAAVRGVRTDIDVLYRRFDEAELAAHRTPAGQSLAALLADAVRAGRLGLANVPGNGLADDAATFPWVPAMIRFYLGEEPLLDSVQTWVLADETQWTAVRDRLHDLVLIPVAGYGGGGTVVGPRCSAAELAELQAEVAAAPHRFVAREFVEPSTVPTLVGGRVVPRHVDLRVFTAALGEAGVRALPAPLTRVALDEGSRDISLRRSAATKDTWLLTR